MSQHVGVSDYNPAWLGMYEKKKALILPILDDNCIAIYHIGSTSVPGLAAKPVIDMMAVVKSLEKVDSVAEKFSEIGRRRRGSFHDIAEKCPRCDERRQTLCSPE